MVSFEQIVTGLAVESVAAFATPQLVVVQTAEQPVVADRRSDCNQCKGECKMDGVPGGEKAGMELGDLKLELRDNAGTIVLAAGSLRKSLLSKTIDNALTSANSQSSWHSRTASLAAALRKYRKDSDRKHDHFFAELGEN